MSLPSSHAGATRPWMFLTNHAYVLIAIAAADDTPMRELADRVGITERAVQRIVAELEAGGYLTTKRVGRRNRYTIHADRPLRHPLVADQAVKDLLALGRRVKPTGR